MFRKPACHIGGAHGEGAAGQAHHQADGDEVPVVGGVAHQEDGGHGKQHQYKHYNTAAEFVGPDAQWYTNERAGEYRHGHQDAGLCFVQAELLLHFHANNRQHHPNHEADCEGKRAENKHGVAFVIF